MASFSRICDMDNSMNTCSDNVRLVYRFWFEYVIWRPARYSGFHVKRGTHKDLFNLMRCFIGLRPHVKIKNQAVNGFDCTVCGGSNNLTREQHTHIMMLSCSQPKSGQNSPIIFMCTRL